MGNSLHAHAMTALTLPSAMHTVKLARYLGTGRHTVRFSINIELAGTLKRESNVNLKNECQMVR